MKYQVYGVFQFTEDMAREDYVGRFETGKFYVYAMNVFGKSDENTFDPATDEIVSGPYDTIADAELVAIEAEEQAN